MCKVASSVGTSQKLINTIHDIIKLYLRNFASHTQIGVDFQTSFIIIYVPNKTILTVIEAFTLYQEGYQNYYSPLPPSSHQGRNKGRFATYNCYIGVKYKWTHNKLTRIGTVRSPYKGTIYNGNAPQCNFIMSLMFLRAFVLWEIRVFSPIKMSEIISYGFNGYWLLYTLIADKENLFEKKCQGEGGNHTWYLHRCIQHPKQRAYFLHNIFIGR